MHVTGGSTNVSVYFQLTLLAGGDATGLTETDFDLSYTRSGSAAAAKVDATAGTAGGAAAHSDNTIVEIDATDCPGLHRVDFPDAAFAAGVAEVLLTVKHTSCFTSTLRVELDSDLGLPYKNVATNIIYFSAVLASDNVTAATGLTPVATKSLDGAAFGATTGTVTELANGIYKFAPSAADCNCDVAVYRFAVATMADTFVTSRFR